MIKNYNPIFARFILSFFSMIQFISMSEVNPPRDLGEINRSSYRLREIERSPLIAGMLHGMFAVEPVAEPTGRRMSFVGGDKLWLSVIVPDYKTSKQRQYTVAIYRENQNATSNEGDKLIYINGEGGESFVTGHDEVESELIAGLWLESQDEYCCYPELSADQ